MEFVLVWGFISIVFGYGIFAMLKILEAFPKVAERLLNALL